jgi:non-canonical purine NTP pyrophosphatase, rdgB/HAM1 family
MVRFVVATGNKGKLIEIKEIMKDFHFNVISMSEAGIQTDIEETGSTFEENALIKAKAINAITNDIVMADDSGLEVDYLDGAPGIHSARFADEGASDDDRNKKLLGLLQDVPYGKRTARFVCVIAVVFPDGSEFTVRGTCEGIVGEKPVGNGGFGYDPLLYIPEYGMTIAEMDMETKNRISHRGNALRKMVEELDRRKIAGSCDSLFLHK